MRLIYRTLRYLNLFAISTLIRRVFHVKRTIGVHNKVNTITAGQPCVIIPLCNIFVIFLCHFQVYARTVTQTILYHFSSHLNTNNFMILEFYITHINVNTDNYHYYTQEGKSANVQSSINTNSCSLNSIKYKNTNSHKLCYCYLIQVLMLISNNL